MSALAAGTPVPQPHPCWPQGLDTTPSPFHHTSLCYPFVTSLCHRHINSTHGRSSPVPRKATVAEGTCSPQPALHVVLLFPANTILFAIAGSCGLGGEKGAGNHILGWWKRVTFGAAADVCLHQRTLLTREDSSPAVRAQALPMALENGHFPDSQGRDVAYVKHPETLSWEAPHRGITESTYIFQAPQPKPLEVSSVIELFSVADVSNSPNVPAISSSDLPSYSGRSFAVW